VLAHGGREGGVVGQGLAKGGHQGPEPRLPFLGSRLDWEALLHQIEHDGHRRAGARRSPQQGGDGAVGCRHHLGAKLQHAAFLFIFLDDLHALAGHRQLPVGGVGRGVVLAQRGGALLRRLQHLPNEVAGEAQVAGPGVEQRPDVAQLNRPEQVCVGALLQKLGAEPGVGPEQQLPAAVYLAGVQVRHRHGRRAHGRPAVHLGLVPGNHGRVLALQPLPAHGKAAKAGGFRNARFFEQWQRAPARSDEHEPRAHDAAFARRQVPDFEPPDAVVLAPEVLHLVPQVRGHARLGLQLPEQGPGEGAKIYVGANGHAGGGHGRGGVAPVHHQRNPGGNPGGVVAEFQALKQGRLQQRGVAPAQVVHAGGAPHKAHVRNAVDEGRGVGQQPLAHQRGPELLAYFELLGDFVGLADVDGAIGALGRVVQLAKGRVAGAGVVPGVGAFGGHGVEALVHGDAQVGVQGFEQGAERGAHDARADEHDVGDGFGGKGVCRKHKKEQARRAAVHTGPSAAGRGRSEKNRARTLRPRTSNVPA